MARGASQAGGTKKKVVGIVGFIAVSYTHLDVYKRQGARVNAPDLRAGAALVIAGLAADGITVVDDIYYIERGYEALEDKLTKIGATIAKVEDEKELQKFILKVS